MEQKTMHLKMLLMNTADVTTDKKMDMYKKMWQKTNQKLLV